MKDFCLTVQHFNDIFNTIISWDLPKSTGGGRKNGYKADKGF